jgi:hypothetical protein
MGTRADFYVGHGEQAEWLGSIAWDGYPMGLTDTGILLARNEARFRVAVAEFIGARNDGTTPEQGWPWPWDNSLTTDYSYAFDSGVVYASCFGSAWWKATEPQPERDDDDIPKVAVFPDMTTRKRVTYGSRSGVLIVTASGPIDPVQIDVEEETK